ncbi:hypothetical protein MTR67_052745 [Solanum verrucosum]|uniref:Uncharacterized protein n=1 Tax=Solanum verrucosum TaxID=315347 RepID=A0AAF1A3H8_SOLVR|nr:hypothetical protein MTR67_052745 [Solanum verrucosum]
MTNLPLEHRNQVS